MVQVAVWKECLLQNVKAAVGVVSQWSTSALLWILGLSPEVFLERGLVLNILGKYVIEKDLVLNILGKHVIE